MDNEILQWVIPAASALGAGLGGFFFGRHNGRREANPHSLTSMDRDHIRLAMENVAGETCREITEAIAKEGEATRVVIRAVAGDLHSAIGKKE